jgi:hypothetical protein
MKTMNKQANQTNAHEAALTDVIDELHTLAALVGAAEQAAYDFSTGEHQGAEVIDRINRLMLVARERIAATLVRADVVPSQPVKLVA